MSHRASVSAARSCRGRIVQLTARGAAGADPSLSAACGGHWVMASKQVTAAGLDEGVSAGAAGLLDAAVAAYLGRFKGVSRAHTESDLRVFLSWCIQHHLDSLHVQRQHLERYVRWMQEVRRFQPSTVGRRLSVVCGFYRTAVLDGVLEPVAGRERPPPTGTDRITHARPRPPPVRGTADRSSAPSSPPCSTPASTCATSKSPPATPTPEPPCATTAPAKPRPPPQLHPRRLHSLHHLTNMPRRVCSNSSNGQR
jgi:hypothetical protein